VRPSAAALLDNVLGIREEIQGNPVDTLSLLTGLRFVDSFFPSGGYAYSSGLEAAVQDGFVRSGEDLSSYVQDLFRQGIARREAVTVAVAHDALINGDIQSALAIDQELHGMKIGRESRMASQQMGRQVLKMASEQPAAHAILKQFQAAMATGRTPGHFPVAFGLTLADAGWGKSETIAAFCYQTAIGFVSAGLKLLPIGQREGQRLLERWTALLDECSTAAAHSTRMTAWSPIQDIYAMRHGRLKSRLFRS
jgi:urease accessory protein